ncbi:Hypothetical protein FKW44_008699 [Caligus rogercresseyi]|uniref:Uncharacterized protein n=1 Tax=Caligus rogercresseyi TaxID=217165 RepID=A0A7T8KGG3_CALRO|nr:Hypothetical protein FKW44_008699 [Caligus rogercresseyi]
MYVNSCILCFIPLEELIHFLWRLHNAMEKRSGRLIGYPCRASVRSLMTGSPTTSIADSVRIEYF